MSTSIYALEIIAILEGAPTDLLHLKLVLEEDIKKGSTVVESFSPSQSNDQVVVMCKKSITKHEAVAFFQKKSSSFPALRIKMELLNIDKKFIAVHKISNNKIDSFSCVWDTQATLDDFVSTHSVTVLRVSEKKNSSIEPSILLPCSNDDAKTLKMVKAFFANMK